MAAHHWLHRGWGDASQTAGIVKGGGVSLVGKHKAAVRKSLPWEQLPGTSHSGEFTGEPETAEATSLGGAGTPCGGGVQPGGLRCTGLAHTQRLLGNSERQTGSRLKSLVVLLRPMKQGAVRDDGERGRACARRGGARPNPDLSALSPEMALSHSKKGDD